MSEMSLASLSLPLYDEAVTPFNTRREHIGMALPKGTRHIHCMLLRSVITCTYHFLVHSIISS